MKKNNLFFLSLIGLFSACAVTLPQVSPTQAEWARSQWPEMTPELLEGSRMLYIDRCSGCHNLYLPASRTVEQWDKDLAKMAPKAKLTPEQKELIWRYIMSAKS